MELYSSLIHMWFCFIPFFTHDSHIQTNRWNAQSQQLLNGLLQNGSLRLLSFSFISVSSRCSHLTCSLFAKHEGQKKTSSSILINTPNRPCGVLCDSNFQTSPSVPPYRYLYLCIRVCMCVICSASGFIFQQKGNLFVTSLLWETSWSIQSAFNCTVMTWLPLVAIIDD